eukprot:scaffold302131_cov18-Tisochrysis_lutea.AAC.1
MALSTLIRVKRQNVWHQMHVKYRKGIWNLTDLLGCAHVCSNLAQDYLVAEGYNNPIYSNGNVIFDAKYYYSQDGVRWVDLVAVDDETKSKAGKIQSILSGDPAK